MGLARSERRALRRIGQAVSRSDPRLDSMLAAFSSFNAGEPKPRREQLRLTPRLVLGALERRMRIAPPMTGRRLS
jgi:hypothetical protein